MSFPENYPLEPRGMWESFYNLTQVPRPSKKEEKVRLHLIQIAKDNSLEWKEDEIGNVVIYLSATSGYQDHETVIIQNHMDMVCDKTPEREINFEEDPIEVYVKNGWVCANGTTLGADNGIGCALALGLIYEKDVAHPPMELLFTVDEETGLNGAIHLDATLLKGKKMINCDTEEWGAIYIGCAGGSDYEMMGEFGQNKGHADYVTYNLELKGLKGGHSGLDIHLNRGNAIKLLGEVLSEIHENDFELVSFDGGKAHNIIPRNASCVIRIPADKKSFVEKVILKKTEAWKKFLPIEDHDFSLTLAETETVKSVICPDDSDMLLSLINMIPHGAYSYNWQSEEPLVNFSSNMAVLRAKEGEIYLQTSVRHTEPEEMISLRNSLKSFAEVFDLSFKEGSGYPGWKPDFNNNLLNLAKDVYREHFGGQAKVRAIHAGLECGLLKEKLGEMDIISIGPNITGAHSPTESLEIDSANKIWEFFIQILKKL